MHATTVAPSIVPTEPAVEASAIAGASAADLAGVPGSILTVARIDEIAADGSLRCGAIRCDALQQAGTPTFARGDEVLICRIASRERGIVLGRVGGVDDTPRPAPARVVVEAADELALRCGDGSIRIRRDGRILVSGSDVVSHARRRNRIKGGSVAIN